MLEKSTTSVFMHAHKYKSTILQLLLTIRTRAVIRLIFFIKDTHPYEEKTKSRQTRSQQSSI